MESAAKLFLGERPSKPYHLCHTTPQRLRRLTRHWHAVGEEAAGGAAGVARHGGVWGAGCYGSLWWGIALREMMSVRGACD